MPYRKLAAGQVPGSVPRILPFVRQRDDVAVEHMEPLGVTYFVLHFSDE